MKRNAMSTPLMLGLLVAVIGLLLPQDVSAQASDQPILEITKKCPSLRYLGRNANFDITVANRGGGAAQNVVVTDTISGGVDFVSADNGGSREGNNIVWRLGTLDAGKTVTLGAVFRCNGIGTVRNAAAVTYCAEARDACEFEVKGIPAILLECLDDPDPIELNGTVTYKIAVTNQGSAVGTNIVIDCTLPAEEEYVSSNGPTTATSTGKKVTFAPLPTLAPKATVTFMIKVKGIGVGDVRFHVSMTSDQVDSPVMETESTHFYE